VVPTYKIIAKIKILKMTELLTLLWRKK